LGKELDIKIPSDQSSINTNNLGEFIWWSARLGISYEKLLSIIEKVGNQTDNVRNYILEHRADDFGI